MLFGFHPVFEALKTGKRQIHALFLEEKTKGKKESALIRMAEKKGIPVKKGKQARKDLSHALSRGRGIAAEADPFPLADPLDILYEGLKNPDPLFLFLDGITDTYNLGALLRSGICAGMDGALIPKDKSASPAPAVSHVSAGAMEHAKIGMVTNLVSCMKSYQEKGVWFYGLVPEAGQSIYEADFAGPVGLVIGNEEKGMRKLVRSTCDFLVTIPMDGSLDSLNASCAGAVSLFEIRRAKKAQQAFPETKTRYT